MVERRGAHVFEAGAKNEARLRNQQRSTRSPTTFLYGKDGSEIATTRIWVSHALWLDPLRAELRVLPHCTAPHCTAPHCTAPYRTAPHRTAPPLNLSKAEPSRAEPSRAKLSYELQLDRWKLLLL
ncbi:hypothetical protein M0802_010053 [Mischocyttarus mexicanus]|nr:hypothetical protein M0802_010053 [Mischocyttarus mexicanus]